MFRLAWFRLLRSRSLSFVTVRNQLCKIYRQLQFLHASAIELSYQFVTTLFPVIVLIVIISFYVAIRHFQETNILFSLVEFFTGVSCLTMMQFCMRFCTRITSLSSEYGDMKFVSLSVRNNSRFFKSCRPFYWKIGPYLTISHLTFLNLTSNVVVASIINLLVLSKL